MKILVNRDLKVKNLLNTKRSGSKVLIVGRKWKILFVQQLYYI